MSLFNFNIFSCSVVLWCCGAVVLWFCSAVVLWCCGAVVLWWCCGASAAADQSSGTSEEIENLEDISSFLNIFQRK